MTDKIKVKEASITPYEYLQFKSPNKYSIHWISMELGLSFKQVKQCLLPHIEAGRIIMTVGKTAVYLHVQEA